MSNPGNSTHTGQGRGVHPVKLVRFLDLGARSRVRGQMTTCTSEALDRLSKLDQCVLRLLLIAVGFIIIGIEIRGESLKSRLSSLEGPPPGARLSAS